MEVRGRDSAGLHLWVENHGFDFSTPEDRALIAERSGNPRFTDGAVQLAGEQLGIVYKTAAEIGELGDNGAALRRSLREETLPIRSFAEQSTTLDCHETSSNHPRRG